MYLTHTAKKSCVGFTQVFRELTRDEHGKKQTKKRETPLGVTGAARAPGPSAALLHRSGSAAPSGLRSRRS